MRRPLALEELFHELVELPPAEREPRLDVMCGDDRVLRARLERLLVRDGESGAVSDLLERGADIGPARPETRVGRYELVRVLAQGGMGIVYEARQEAPRRTVALKMLRCELPSESAQRRFRYEAEILGQLRHPGIAQVFDAGTHLERTGLLRRTVPWFAMELVDDARDLLGFADRAGLDRDQRLRLFSRVCAAVQHGHERGIIHRDLKPGNILVDRRGRPKLIDFGIARAEDRAEDTWTPQTMPGQLMGTPRYMSPEQLEGDAGTVGIRSDVYSLGVVLYELLCGRPPRRLEGLPAARAAERIRGSVPPAPSTIDPALEGEPDWIVAKAMEPDPEARYASVSELAADVRRFLAGLPVSVGPRSRGYRWRVFVRRNRALVGGATFLLGALVAGLALMSDLYFRTSRAEARERREAARANAHLENVKEAARRTRLVNEFMIDVFSAPSIDRIGTELRASDLLAHASERASRVFGEEPRTEIELRRTFSKSWGCLRHFPNARAELTRAIELQRELLDTDPRTLAKDLLRLADLSLDSYEHAGVPALLDEADALVAHDEDLALQSLLLRAGAHRKGGDWERAEAALAGATEIAPDAGRRREVEAAYGQVYLESGRPALAEPPLRRAFEAARDEHGELSALTQSYRIELAEALRLQGRGAEADELMGETPVTSDVVTEVDPEIGVRLRTESLVLDLDPDGDPRGPARRGPRYSGPLYRLEHVFGRSGADRILKERLDLARREGGEHGPGTLRAKSELGVLHYRSGAYGSAEPWLRDAARLA